MSTKTLFLGQTLSSSLWKYVLHGVAPLLGVEVGLLDDLHSVGGEHPAEEEVDEEDLGGNSIENWKFQRLFNRVLLVLWDIL